MSMFNSILSRLIGNKKQKEAAEMLAGMVNAEGEDIFPQPMGPAKEQIVNIDRKSVV